MIRKYSSKEKGLICLMVVFILQILSALFIMQWVKLSYICFYFSWVFLSYGCAFLTATNKKEFNTAILFVFGVLLLMNAGKMMEAINTATGISYSTEITFDDPWILGK